MSHEDFAYIIRKAEEARRAAERRQREENLRLANKIASVLNSARSRIGDFRRQADKIASRASAMGISRVRKLDSLKEAIQALEAESTRLTVPAAGQDQGALQNAMKRAESFRLRVAALSAKASEADSLLSSISSRIQDIRSVRSKVASQLRHGSDSGAEIDQMMAKYEVAPTEGYNELKDRFREYGANARELENASMDSDDPAHFEKLYLSCRNLSEKIATEDRSFKAVEDDIRSRYSSRLSGEISELIARIRASEDKLKQEKADAASIARIREEEQQKAREQERRQKIIDLARKEFDDLAGEPVVNSRISGNISALRERFENLLENGDSNLSDVYAITIQPRIRKIREEITAYRDLAGRFNELYARYAVLAEDCREELKDFALSESSIPFLQSEIQRLTETAARLDRQLTAAEAIRMSLEEMGYEFIGQETDLPASVAASTLFRDARGNGLNVVVRTNGRCSLEHGALSMEDEELTYDEARKVAAETEHFCSSHSLLAEIMARNGLTAQEVERMAPSPENAMMINASNFHVADNVAQEIVRHRQEARQAGQAAAGAERKLYADQD